MQSEQNSDSRYYVVASITALIGESTYFIIPYQKIVRYGPTHAIEPLQFLLESGSLLKTFSSLSKGVRDIPRFGLKCMLK